MDALITLMGTLVGIAQVLVIAGFVVGAIALLVTRD